MATEQDWATYADQAFLATNDTLLARTNVGGGVEIAGQHIFAARSASGAANITVNGSVRATIDTTGRVGIGTTAMAYNLDVRDPSGAGLNVQTTSGNATARVASVAGGTANLELTTTAGLNRIVAGTGGTPNMLFQTNSVERMRIDSSGNITSTGGGVIGYGTGSGGAVTQATSRTTGVTLNTASGAITLVSAAGSTSWQTFTVTNSKVAATDVVHVCQKSGTDLYEIHVTNVAAGSFKISFKTTGGTTTEQPVFNFVVFKAATS